MGIRFYCPNGHKLNVKEFQAGRRGICPFCGAKIQIPTQSTRPSSKELRQRSAAAAAGTHREAVEDDESDQASDSSPTILPGEPPVTAPAAPDRSAAAAAAVGAPAAGAPDAAATGKTGAAPPLPQPEIAAASPPAPAGSGPPPGATTTPASIGSPPAGPVAAPLGPAPPPSGDAIADAPEMIWYVRPPTGGQFGPASGEVMRNWLAEGRVSAECLVWREGWRDWQEAAAVFPQLRASEVMDFLETASIVPTVPSAASHTHHPKTGSKSDNLQSMLLVLLSLGVIILVAVFLIVLFR
ncbi:MAG: DUF4339 domain-containing protein [Thermoguttaceae bacterium]